MNTICKFADIDTYFLYFLDIKTVLKLTTISKEQYILILNLDYVKELYALVQKHGYYNIIDNAANYNYISLIKKISQFSLWEFKYTEDAINLASGEGHIDVLEWFANSKYEFIYTKDAINFAAGNGARERLQ